MVEGKVDFDVLVYLTLRPIALFLFDVRKLFAKTVGDRCFLSVHFTIKRNGLIWTHCRSSRIKAAQETPVAVGICTTIGFQDRFYPTLTRRRGDGGRNPKVESGDFRIRRISLATVVPLGDQRSRSSAQRKIVTVKSTIKRGDSPLTKRAFYSLYMDERDVGQHMRCRQCLGSYLGTPAACRIELFSSVT